MFFDRFLKKKEENKIVIIAVVMRRYGNRDDHSYLLGVWVDKPFDIIYKEAFKEKRRRGNKYDPEFCIIDFKKGFVIERWIEKD